MSAAAVEEEQAPTAPKGSDSPRHAQQKEQQQRRAVEAAKVHLARALLALDRPRETREAVRLWREVLEARWHAEGADSDRVRFAKVDLAAALSQLGDHDLASAINLEVHAALLLEQQQRRRAPGGQGRTVAMSAANDRLMLLNLGNLATARARAGDLATAEKVAMAASAGWLLHYGGRLVVVHGGDSDGRRFDEVRQAAADLELVAGLRRACVSHAAVPTCRSPADNEGRVDALRREAQVRAGRFGGDHACTLAAKVALAAALCERGDNDGSVALGKQVAAAFARAGAAGNDPRVLANANNLAVALARAGDFAAARRTARAVVRGWVARLSAGGDRSRCCCENARRAVANAHGLDALLGRAREAVRAL